MAMIKCPECGQEISDESKVCIHCGYNFRKPQKKKKWILIVGIIIMLIAIAMAIGMKTINANQGYYDDNKWGTTKDEIKEKYGDDITQSYLNKDSLAMYSDSFYGVEGICSMVQFEFDDDRLDTVLVMVSNHDSNMLDSEVYNMVIDEYTKEYGTPEDASYGLSWETSKSIIAVKQYPGTTDGTMIMYSKKGD